MFSKQLVICLAGLVIMPGLISYVVMIGLLSQKNCQLPMIFLRYTYVERLACEELSVYCQFWWEHESNLSQTASPASREPRREARENR